MTARTPCWVFLSALGVLLVGASGAANWSPRVVYNASPSLPLGFYSVRQTGQLTVGDLVVVDVPQDFEDLLSERGYLPRGVPLIKRVTGLPGDHVCYRDGMVFLNEQPIVRVLERDGAGRPIPLWRGCRHLHDNEFFAVIQEVETSLDSRYFGPLDRDQIVGKAAPLWVFDP